MVTAAADVLHNAAMRDRMEITRGQIHGIDSFVCRGQPEGVTTKLHTFMVVGLFPTGWATRAMADRFVQGAVEYSIAAKGGLPRGAQTGTATIPVVLTDAMAPGAERWAARPSGRRFAALSFPVSVELAQGRVTCPRTMLLGAAYIRPMKRFVAEHITDVLYPQDVTFR